jgi:hypothetical protein
MDPHGMHYVLQSATNPQKSNTNALQLQTSLAVCLYRSIAIADVERTLASQQHKVMKCLLIAQDNQYSHR